MADASASESSDVVLYYAREPRGGSAAQRQFHARVTTLVQEQAPDLESEAIEDLPDIPEWLTSVPVLAKAGANSIDLFYGHRLLKELKLDLNPDPAPPPRSQSLALRGRREGGRGARQAAAPIPIGRDPMGELGGGRSGDADMEAAARQILERQSAP